MHGRWQHDGGALPPAAADGPDSLRAWEPWVLEEPGRVLRMWYSGHDGTTARILEAEQRPGEPWRRTGTAVDPGLAGESDGYGVSSPCVVPVDEGYLMAYTGFDGRISRLHLARSPDGRRWTAAGAVTEAEGGGPIAGGTPCLVVGDDQWWLFYSGSEAPDDREGGGAQRRTGILAAVSRSGAEWDPIGSVLLPEPGEASVSHPCVVEISRRWYLFYASESGESGSIALATSSDAVEWTRRGIVLSAAGDDPEAAAVTAPCAVRLADGSLRLWYSRRPWGDDQLAYSVCAARLGPWPSGVQWPGFAR